MGTAEAVITSHGRRRALTTPVSRVPNALNQSVLLYTRRMGQDCVRSVQSSFIAPALAVVD